MSSRGRGRGRARTHEHSRVPDAAASAHAAHAGSTEPTDITIDGSQGEGGGQILRTSLSLAIILNKSVRIFNIRAGRPKPGLARQHLVAVTAAAELGGGELLGAALGSTELVYRPPAAGVVLRPSYAFDIGSAGSTSLVLQTLLPILLVASRNLTYSIDVLLSGGTHNPLSPPYDFIRACFLPALARMGWKAEVELLRHGFFPAGGGRLKLRVHPAEPLVPFRLLARGPFLRRSATVMVAGIADVDARRQEGELRKQLEWKGPEVDIVRVESNGPGNVMFAAVEYEHTTEVVTAFLNRPSDTKDAMKAVATEISEFVSLSTAPVGEHLADQLLLPLLLGGGGEYRLSKASEHFRTNVTVIEAFVGPAITYAEAEPNGWHVKVDVPSAVRELVARPAVDMLPGGGADATGAAGAAASAVHHA